MTPEEATAELLARASWRFSRASGPGGQHRDHSETRAELHVPRAALDDLPPDVASRLAEGLCLDRRPLRMVAQAQRSRERNRALVEERLRARVAAALAPRRPRRATRPTAASERRRREAKARRALVKAGRRAIASDD